MRLMRHTIRNNLRETFLIGNIINWHEELRLLVRRRLFGHNRF
jgi:hypothetical protein